MRTESRKAAVILAGGKGRRMGTDVPKQFLEIGGKPLIFYTLKAFEESCADVLVLVAPPGGKEYCRKEIVERFGFRKVKYIAEGGAERYDSVYAGLLALQDERCGFVAVHDGARSLVTPELIRRTFEAAEQYGACVAAVPVKDTIKRADEKGYAAETLPREQLRIIQTPQTFRFDLCFDAYSRMMEGSAEERKDITDDAMVVERFTDARVKLVEGDYRNLKVTTPEDIGTAENLLRQAAVDKSRRVL